MTKRLIQLLLILSFVAELEIPAWSQDSLALEARVDLILANFPTSDRYSTDLACIALLENGPEAWQEVISRLVPASYGDDLAARYAISTLAKFLGGSNGAGYREQMENEFIHALNEKGLQLDVQAFLIDQLQYFATNTSVSGLKEIALTICEPVVATWNAIGSDNALNAMIELVPSVMGTCRINLTKSISTYSHPQAITTLRALVNDPDPTVSEIALEGLATNGDPTAYPSLSAQATDARGFERLIKYGNARGLTGDVGTVHSITKSVMKSDQSAQIKTGALTMASSFLGAGAKKYLIKSLKKGDAQLRTGAIEALSLNREIPLTSILKYYDKLPPAAQLKLLSISSSRNEPLAIPYARKALQASDMDLKLAGIRAISSLMGRESFTELTSIFKSNSDPEILSRLAAELSRHTDASNLPGLLELLGTSHLEGKMALMEVLSTRGGPEIFSAISNELSSDNEALRTAAFASIPRMAKSVNLETLVGLLPGFIRSDGREDLLNSIVLKIQDEQDHEVAVGNLINLTQSQNQEDVLADLLPRIGGNTAFRHMWPESVESVSPSDQDLDKLLRWNGPEAIFPLIDFVNKSEGSAKSQQAIDAILRNVGSARVNAVQRYLILRELWDESPASIKSGIVQHLGQSPTYPTLMWCSELMKEPEYAEDAARASIQVALPSTERPEGFHGIEVRSILLRADTIAGSQLDPYSKAILEKYLREMSQNPGFTSMFDGEDLAGWQGLVDNPIARDTMFAYMLRQKQSIADFTMRENWGVQDGVIEFHGDGYDNLCSVESYRDFEFLVDWKIEKDGDSGIYLRGSPQVQIWDPNQKDGTKVGSGGLFNNEVHPSQPLIVADNPVGHWNNFRIVMIDERVTVYLNGDLVTDNVIMENYWDRSQSIFREGPIELQAHTTPLEFRNIYVRPIEGAYDVPRAESFDGFKPLFNGINLAGWVGNKTDYVAENGEIVIYPSTEGGHGNLYTEKEYGNFVLRFQFKLTPGANNGLGVHAPLEGDAAYLGKELQILDNNAPQYANLESWQFHGSLYGVMPAKRGYLKPVGEWNTQEVTFDGERVKVVLNGATILLDHIGRATREGTVDGKEHPGLNRKKGHIGFLGHGSKVHFRHIRIKELPDTEVEEDR